MTDLGQSNQAKKSFATPIHSLRPARIEMFALDVPTASVQDEDVLGALEAALHQQLPNCQRLLRWAVMTHDQDHLQVEGAYVSQAS